MQRLFSVCIIGLVLIAAGCGSSQMIKDSWKFTAKQYRTYLNTPADLDFEDKGSCEVYEIALGEAAIAVDAELAKFIRAMENSDHSPDQSWVMGMMNRFPWLSGVALVDGQGQLVARYPEYFAKEFTAGPLLEPDPKQRMGELRGYIDMAPQGAEVYLANPVFGQEVLRGLVIAHFDPKSLVMYSPNPGGFMIASPQGVIWPGIFAVEATPVGTQDWAALLKEKSCGIIGEGSSEFFWTTRYVGNVPLVYAMPVSTGRFSDEHSQTIQPPSAEPGGSTTEPLPPATVPETDTPGETQTAEGRAS